jgi:hypothetical protein
VRIIGSNELIRDPVTKQDKDRDIQVQIFRKEGNIVDFNRFYKKMMKDAMDMFVEPEK